MPRNPEQTKNSLLTEAWRDRPRRLLDIVHKAHGPFLPQPLLDDKRYLATNALHKRGHPARSMIVPA